VLLPLALVFEQPWTARPDAATWTALLSLGLVSTALAYILYFRILASAGATNLLLVTFLIPIAALLLGTIILGEEISLAALLGMVLIFAGLAVIDGRLLRFFNPAASPKSGSTPGISSKDRR
jgi:drug/metabolite transporter (DMT)-like permease